MLTNSSGKHLEDGSHAHIVSLVFKLITTAKGYDDLSIGFHRDHGIRQRELTNNKNIKSKYHVKVYIKVVFEFPNTRKKQHMV